MIPIPGGLTARLILGAAFALCFILVGMGTHKVFADRKIATIERNHAHEREQAALAAAAAQAEQQRIGEQRTADVLAALDKANADLAVTHGALAAALRARDGLRNKLADYTRPREAGPDPAAARADLQHRVETLGLLLAELDELAGASSRAADTLRDELAACRAYARAIAPAH